MGGDEVNISCWIKFLPKLKEYIKENNIPGEGSLEKHFRIEQRKFLKEGKSALYWE